MILNPNTPYLIMDKSRLILKLFNTAGKNVTHAFKSSMIAVAFKKGDGWFEYERRTVIEVVNTNTIIVDTPFPIQADMPEYIFDFKIIAISGSKNDRMNAT